MISYHFVFSLSVGSLLLASCGVGGATAGPTATALITVSSSQLAAYLSSVPEAAVVENYRVMSALTFAQFFDQVAVPNAKLNYSLDGTAVTDRLPQLLQRRAAFVAFDKIYANLGAYFQHVGLNPGANLGLLGSAYPDYVMVPTSSCYHDITKEFGKGGLLEGAAYTQVEYIMDSTAAAAATAGSRYGDGFNPVKTPDQGTFLANRLDAQRLPDGSVNFYLYRFKTAAESYEMPDPSIPPDPTLNSCFYDRSDEPVPVQPVAS